MWDVSFPSPAHKHKHTWRTQRDITYYTDRQSSETYIKTDCEASAGRLAVCPKVNDTWAQLPSALNAWKKKRFSVCSVMVLTLLNSRNDVQLFARFSQRLMSLPLKFNSAHARPHAERSFMCCLCSTWSLFLPLCSVSNQAELEEGGFDSPDRPLSAFVYCLLRSSHPLAQRTGRLCFNNSHL